MIEIDGAGVEILAMPFWEQTIPRQPYSWTILPTGKTAWVSIFPTSNAIDSSYGCIQGLDWHGPSTTDALDSVTALYEVLQKQSTFSPWLIAENTKIAVIGHSNGGQGAWYLGSRYPDKVIGGQ